MDMQAFTLIGVGLYTVPEASRLTGVSQPRIRRWLRGYAYKSGDQTAKSEPVWQAQLPIIDKSLALGFLDLMEVRFVNAFREHGVGWKEIRMAATEARRLFKQNHPFAAKRFLTDGKKIFADIVEETGEKRLLQLSRSQYAFRQVISPSLHAGLDFSADTELVERWWPLGKRRPIVIDPDRAFGQAIVHREGVPTAVLANALRVEKSVNRVAALYDVESRVVRSAVRFEEKLAA